MNVTDKTFLKFIIKKNEGKFLFFSFLGTILFFILFFLNENYFGKIVYILMFFFQINISIVLYKFLRFSYQKEKSLFEDSFFNKNYGEPKKSIIYFPYLDVYESTDPSLVKQVYRKKMKENHPDLIKNKGKEDESTKISQILNEEYEAFKKLRNI